MANLNMRDRLIETTIAYLGAPLAGTSTNLDQLLRTTDVARTSVVERSDHGVSFDWRPLHFGKFDDADVSVRVVSGSTSSLSSVDGVVLILDSDPGALEKNRAATKELRAALGERSIPVVVQLNKRDLPGALAEEALVAALEISNWPAVSASAANGEGVVETLRRAIEGVLVMMKQTDTQPPLAGGRVAEQNPLLNALRGILEDAVREQVEALEERVHERFAGRASELTGLRNEIALIRREIAGLDRPIEAALQKQREQIVASVAAFQRTLDAAVAELRKSEQAQTARLTTAIGSVAEGQDAVIGALSPVSVEVARVATKLDTLEPRVAKAVEDRTQRIVGAAETRTNSTIESTVDAGATRLEARVQQLDERTAAIAAQLDELIEELKKRKKGWFG